MTFRDKVVAILTERSFEIRDGASKMEVVEATDFEQLAMDIQDLLKNDYNLDPDEIP